ncbi:type II toxin-antitoxin system HicA family toxin [Candidatus Peregrinibacteria bacterium]|nr:type II toxin-antitoxin system HicA family toxin [Candidatus Peregrinibacteria bacterium]
MGKLKKLSQQKIIQILQNNGFRQVRARKHITFKKITREEKVLTTWVPHHREVTIFVIQYIIKQTGKPREEFES